MVSELLLANASNNPMATASDSSLSSATFHLPPQVISIKLDGTNFLAWSAQLLHLFQSYGLMGIVDGSGFCPPQFSSEEHKVRGLLILLIWFGSIRTKQYLAGLSPHYLLRWSPPRLSKSRFWHGTEHANQTRIVKTDHKIVKS